MVSKSKILGKSIIVFITVGSTNFQLDRVLSSIDQILVKEKHNYYVIAQIGKSEYKWQYKKIKIIDYLAPNKLISNIKQADKIISHGGPISIYQIAIYAKNMPLIVPRLAQFKEHVDNHQLHFAKFLQNKLPKEFKKCFVVDTDLNKSVSIYLKEEQQKNILKKYLFNNSTTRQLVKNLDAYIKG